MPIREKFVYAWPEGVTPIYFHEWIATLPEAERLLAEQAVARQTAIRTQYINDGKMTMWNTDSNGQSAYDWKDRESWEKNKPSDPEWMKFWARYIAETQTIFTRIQEEI